MQCLQYPARISGTLFIFFRVEADNQFYYRLAYGRHFLVYNILQLCIVGKQQLPSDLRAIMLALELSQCLA